MLVWLHLGVLFLEVELNILLIVTGTPLEVDAITLEIMSANTKDYVGKLCIGPLHVEDPTFHQHLVVLTHKHFP
jgi:hypothetical protein